MASILENRFKQVVIFSTMVLLSSCTQSSNGTRPAGGLDNASAFIQSLSYHPPETTCTAYSETFTFRGKDYVEHTQVCNGPDGWIVTSDPIQEVASP